jgi:hypothetical protein
MLGMPRYAPQVFLTSGSEHKLALAPFCALDSAEDQIKLASVWEMTSHMGTGSYSTFNNHDFEYHLIL